MVKKAKEISPGRYRETFGRYYEEFQIGDIYEHRPGRTITQSDNTWFTLLTMNQHPIHIDEELRVIETGEKLSQMNEHVINVDNVRYLLYRSKGTTDQ